MRFLHFLVFTVLLCCGTTEVLANHVLGGNITWTCLGGDQYRIRLTAYQDCYGYDLSTGFPLEETIFLIPSGCSSSSFAIDLEHISHTEISDLCPTELTFSSCSGGVNQGTIQFIYEANVTLSPGCNWKVVWSNGDWSYYINSTLFPQPFYISSIINTNFPCSQSPTIISTVAAPQIPYLCVGVPEAHHLGLNNLPTGYSVDYSLDSNQILGASIFSPPIDNPGWSLPPGMTTSSPSSTGITINWTPGGSDLGTNVVRVEILIYDASNNLVGTINETMVFYVRNCAVTNTQFTAPPVIATGPETTLTGSNNISVCAGDSLIFTVSAFNPNPLRSVTITDILPIPGLTGLAATSNGTNPANRTYKLLTTGANVGTFTLNIHAQDDACPNPDIDDAVINITVHPNVQLTFTDTTICYLDNVTLVAQGLANNAYDWSVISGDFTPTLSDNQATQTVSPDSTTVYRVAALGIPAACQNADTATVHVVMRDLTYTKADETCGNNNGSINLTVVGEASSNITYSWSPVLPATQNQSSLNAGSYTVTVNETVYGCQLTESITIADIPAPTATFTGSTTICEGDNAELTLTLTQGSAPWDITSGSANLPSGLTGLPLEHDFIVSPATTTTYTITGIRDASLCSATVNLSVTVTVRPRVTATLDSAGPICLGDDPDLTLTYSIPGTYDVNYNVTSPTPPTLPHSEDGFSGGSFPVDTPTEDGTYNYNITSIEYTNAPTCPSTDISNLPVNVVVNESPTATLSGGGTTVCTGGCRNLTITLTGTGPWIVTYTANNGVPIDLPQINSSPFTWNVCPNATTNYCITRVEDAICTRDNITGVCAQVTVTPYPTVSSYTLSDTELCTGESTTINVNWGPAGNTGCLHFHSNPTNQGVNTAFCSQSTPNFSLLVTPTSTTAYCLDSVYFTGTAAHCATVLNQCITVNVNGNISVAPTDTICNNISTQYQIEYTISGGEIGSGYLEAAGGGTGAFDPLGSDTYLTSLVSNGPSPSWVFSDVNACNTVTMNTSYTCPVLTNPGTMNLTPINVCGDGQATAIHNNTTQYLDNNDELMFILYNGDGSGVQIATNCSAPVFSFLGPPLMEYGITYYINAVAGDAGAPAGCVNLFAPAGYVVVSPGTPVTWYEAPTATLSAPGATAACVGSCVTLEIELTGQAPWTINYTVGGVAQTAIPVNVAPPGNIYSMCVTAAGTYTLTGISSGAGPIPCAGTVNGSVAVTINALPTAVLSADAETCSGIDHCFEIAFTGPGPWDVIINDPDDINDTVNDIPTPSPYQYCVGASGDYNIISVTDNNGCTNTTPSDTVNLFVHPLPTVQWTFGDTTFCEGSSIELVIAMTGESPFDIDITSPDTDITDASLQNVLSPDTIYVDVEGDYIIASVTDNNDCVSAAGATIHLDQIDAPIADAGPDLDQCVGLPITIGTPAVGGQIYSWSPQNGIPGTQTDDAQPTVTHIAIPGTNPIEYEVTATVGICISKDTMLLTIHDLPSIEIIADEDSLCANECTNLLVNNLGSGTLAYEWTASTSITSPLTDNPVQVCPSANETFEVTATETHGLITCEATETIDIVIGTALTVAEDYTEEVCNGTCEGEILLTPSGGFTPYEFAPPALSDLQEMLTSGHCPDTYDYIILDNIGCEYIGSITIEERDPEVITGDDLTITQPTCAYDLGQVQVHSAYTSYQLIPAGDCTYGFEPNPNGTGTFLQIPPCDDPYTLEVTFQVSPTEECSTTTTILIQPLSSEIDFNPVIWPDNLFCYDEQACFEGNPTGGTTPLDIFWYTCPQLLPACEETTAEPFCLAMQEDHVYYGVAIDDLGCRSDTVMLEALLYPEITLEVQGGLDTTAICEFDCIDLVAGVSGGNGNIGINWLQEPATQVGSDSPLNVCPLFTTTYYAIASDGCSQPVNDTIVVVVHDTPEALIDADIFEGCYPQTINFINLSDAVPDNHTCVWNFGAGTITHCGDTSFTYPTYGTFNPTFTITTEYGCVDIDTLDMPIVIYGKPDMGFTWEPQPVTVINNQVEFINTTTAGVSYVWTVYGLGSTVLENPTFILPPIDQGSYEVCLEATTIHGCKDTLCQDVFMETVLQVFVPNAFTPDVAGTDDAEVNDVWLPIVTGIDINRYELRVVNHWGEEVFMTTDPYKPWTGNFNGGDSFVPDDTYVWHIKCYEMNSTKLSTFMGHVTIVR